MNLRRLNARNVFAALLALALGQGAILCRAQDDPVATEPTVVAVNKALPAVVNINTERVIKHTVRDPFDEFYNQFFGGQTARSRTYSQKVQSLGSGFIVDPEGYIVTNEHVVQRAADLKIAVTTSDGKTYNARYVTGSPESDLAFLKIEGKGPMPFINLHDLSPNLLGETVLVVGNPLGYGTSVSRGILSAKGRAISVENVDYKDLLQTDAAINPGNSGGPLIDLAGRLVGVSSVKMAFTPQGVPTQGMGFAIPAEDVRDKVEQFKTVALKTKSAPAPAKNAEPASLAQKYFGLQLQDLTEELADALGYPAAGGALIAEVDPGSPADEAGMKRGLVIYQVGRYQVASSKRVEQLLEPVSTGSVVDFTVGIVRRVRGQTQRQLQPVTLTAR
jgi:S1-C subfamily serine protease